MAAAAVLISLAPLEAMPCPPPPTTSSAPAVPTERSPGRQRHAIRPATIVAEGKTFPGSDFIGPLAELRDRIMSSDRAFLFCGSREG